MADSIIEMSVDEVISTEHGDIIIPLVDTSQNIELVKIEKMDQDVVEVVEFQVTDDSMILPNNSEEVSLTELVPVSEDLSGNVTETVKADTEHVQNSDKNVSLSNEGFQPNVVSTPAPDTKPPQTFPKQLVELPLRTRTKLLYSNILTDDDIAKEVLARQELKRQSKPPPIGDLLFKKQLTKRLAEKVVKEESLNPNISVEMFTPPPPPKLPTISDTPDMDAQMLLQILEEGAESHYTEPPKKIVTPKIPKYFKSEKDREREKQIALQQLMQFSSKKGRPPKENNNNKPKKKLKLNEVERLLQDEGAINMLYSIEKGENVKATALPSKRRMKKALQKKQKEVQQAVLEGSIQKKGLRLRHPTKDSDDIKKDQEGEGASTVENSTENKSDFVSPNSSTPVASKIIRRHSSSSSYSGNNSPVRRISLDESGKSDGEKVTENGTVLSPKKTPVKGKRVKLIQKTLNNSVIKKNITEKVKLKKIIKPNPGTPVAGSSKITEVSQANKIDLPEQNGFKEKLQLEFSNKLKSMIKRQSVNKSIPNKTPKTLNVDKQLLAQNKSLTCEAIWQMLQDDWNMGEDPDDPSPFHVTRNDDTQEGDDEDFDRSPDNSVCEMDIKPLHKTEIAPLPTSEPGINEEIVIIDSDNNYENYSLTLPSIYYSFLSCNPQNDPCLESSVFSLSSPLSKLDVIPENKSEVPFSHQYGSSSYMYKELMLRRIGPLTHVNIAPISTHLPQAFNVQVLKELCSVMDLCTTDTRCRCLLLTSSGSLFSSGVDLPSLLASDQQTRSLSAKTMAAAVKEFAHKLAMFSKMIVAGVSGPCVGLGVAMLPMCDVVISSPKSIYLTPYASLGYIPEAASTLTLPNIIGHRMASSMLIGGRKLSAEEAVNCGLVTQLLPEENFANQVLEHAFKIATQSVQSMESTKALMMHSIRTRLNNVLVAETALLQQHWLTHDCQIRIKDKADKLLNE